MCRAPQAAARLRWKHRAGKVVRHLSLPRKQALSFSILMLEQIDPLSPRLACLQRTASKHHWAPHGRSFPELQVALGSAVRIVDIRHCHRRPGRSTLIAQSMGATTSLRIRRIRQCCHCKRPKMPQSRHRSWLCRQAPPVVLLWRRARSQDDCTLAHSGDGWCHPPGTHARFRH